MRGTDLRLVDFTRANLREADLRWADLGEADLTRANLTKADLRKTNLTSTRGGVAGFSGLPSGHATIQPTPIGWMVRVGCWSGSVGDLAEMISGDEGWPEAVGAECARRRPSLQAWVALCRAHIDLHPGLIEKLAEVWPDSVAA